MLEQASSLVDIGDTMLTAGLVQPMSDQVAKPLLAIAGLVWKWLDTNRFYFPDDAIHATAYAYFGEIGLFSSILERPSSVTVEQSQHVNNQLYQPTDAL